MSEPVPFGKYWLVEPIAVGGMAEIYRAVAYGVDGRQFDLAIKRILPQFSNDEEFISMMIDEAKLMVRLNHPNIVPIVEFGKVEGSYFIAMEYVHGVTLKELFRALGNANQPFSIDLAVYVVREIATGLAYAHRKTDEEGRPLNLVHRDISPANILISFDGDVRITDFGIARAADQSHRTQIGIIRGKTGYMSPEQTRANAPLDQRSDIFSLGIILYELLSGRRLFQAAAVPEALKMIRECRIPPLAEPRPDVPPELEAIVRKALAAGVAERYQRAEELADALNEFLTRWSPKGRPLRVTHQHLAGFVGRFFPEEASAPLAPVEIPAPVPEADTVVDTLPKSSSKEEPTFSGPTRRQTIASNPLYELSEPESVIPRQAAPSDPAPPPPPAVGALESAGSGAVTFTRAGWFSTSLKVALTAGVVALPLGVTAWFVFRSPGPRPPSPAVGPRQTALPKVADRVEPDPPVERTDVAHVQILTEPPGAKVFFDGKELAGRTPLDLPAIELNRDYAIRITARGYQPLDSTIRRTRAETTVQRFILVTTEALSGPSRPPPSVPKPPPLGSLTKPARLSVRTEPWSDVYVDGVKVETTPFAGKSVASGLRKIRFVAQNQKPVEFRVRLPAGGDVRCFYSFKAGGQPDCRAK